MVPAPPPASDRVWVLETNLDDLPGEVVGYTMIKLMEAGALDAFLTPIQMKKNRPGTMISVLCDEARIPIMEEILFRETSTLGIRRYPVSRHKLKRQGVEVETRYGMIRGKLGWLENRPPTFSPEYEDCARVAAASGVPLREVYDAAHAAYLLRHCWKTSLTLSIPRLRPCQHQEASHETHYICHRGSLHADPPCYC